MLEMAGRGLQRGGNDPVKEEKVCQLFKAQLHTGVYVGQSQLLVTHFYGDYVK